jgi:hypothetical protein
MGMEGMGMDGMDGTGASGRDSVECSGFVGLGFVGTMNAKTASSTNTSSTSSASSTCNTCNSGTCNSGGTSSTYDTHNSARLCVTVENLSLNRGVQCVLPPAFLVPPRQMSEEEGEGGAGVASAESKGDMFGVGGLNHSLGGDNSGHRRVTGARVPYKI